MSKLIDLDIILKDLLHQSAHEALAGHPENARGLLYAVDHMKTQPSVNEQILDKFNTETSKAYQGERVGKPYYRGIADGLESAKKIINDGLYKGG